MDTFSQPTDQQALTLTHAIALKESGNGGMTPNYNAVGDNGTSHGAYQWQPGNFESDAKKYGLDPKDRSPQNQDKVAYAHVKEKKDAGWQPDEIAASWNAGDTKAKNGEWKTNVGTTTINGKPLHYDTPGYVQGVHDYYTKLTSGNNDYNPNPYSNPDSSQNAPTPTPLPQNDPNQEKGIGEQLTGRMADAGQALSDASTGKINPISGVLQTVGAGAGAIGDTVNAAGNFVTGGLLGKAERGIGKVIGAVGKATGISKGISDFSQAHPEVSKDISSIVDIASLFPLFKGMGIAKEAASGIIGKIAGRDALSSIVSDISPEIKVGTKAGASAVKGVGNTQSGMLGSVSRATDPSLVRDALIVNEAVPTWSKLPTYTSKVDALYGGVGKYANELTTNLNSAEIKPLITQDTLNTLKSDVEQKITESPVLVGDPGIMAQKMLNYFVKQLPQTGDITVLDGLNARQSLDTWVKGMKGEGVFDPAKQNNLSIGLRTVRQNINSMLDSSAPDANVKALLNKQSSLYRTIDNIAPKADAEVGTNKIGRFGNRHPVIKGALKTAGKYAAGAVGAGTAYGLYKDVTGK